MTLGRVLCWILGMSTGLGVLLELRVHGLRRRGWLLVQALVCAIAVTGALLESEVWGYVVAACWLVWVKGPSVAAQLQYQHALGYRFGEAARWARIAGLLHPFDGVPAQTIYLRAQEAAYAGNEEQARALLQQLAQFREYVDVGRVELWRLDRNWARIIEFIEQGPKVRLLHNFATPYLRALGETRQVSRMLSEYAALAPMQRQQPMVRLLVLAYAGRPELVQRLFESSLGALDANARDYWLGVALQASGDQERAARHFEGLISRGVLRRQASERLDFPLAPVEPGALSPEVQRALADLARDVEEARSIGSHQLRRVPIATFGMAAVLVAVFMLRFRDGWDDVEGLIRLGALVLPPELVQGGVLWRVVCAGLLHVNATHLGMNVASLWVLGRDLERIWGSLAVFSCVLSSSVAAYATALFFMPASAEHPKLLVGASAGVMGLVGAIIAFSAVGYFGHQRRTFARSLRAAGLLVMLQFLFDAFTPMVSSFLHIAGLVSGALLALPFSMRHFSRRANARDGRAQATAPGPPTESPTE